MKNLFFALSVAVLVSGCAGKPVISQSIYSASIDTSGIQVSDTRTDDQKMGGRTASLFAPIRKLGDHSLPHDVQDSVSRFVAREMPGKELKVEVLEFMVFDYFAKDQAKTQVGGSILAESLSKTLIDIGKSRMDWTLIDQLGMPKHSNSTISYVKLQIAGKQYEGADYSEHTPGLLYFSLPRMLTPQFKNAIELSTGGAIKKALDKYKAEAGTGGA